MSQNDGTLRNHIEELWKDDWKSPDVYGFQLTSGRGVLLHSFHMGETYAGLLSGVPDEAYNDKCVIREVSRMNKTWGWRRYGR